MSDRHERAHPRRWRVLAEDHLQHCVTHAFESGDEATRRAQVDELLEVFARFGGRG